jgi:hypothetical protein
LSLSYPRLITCWFASPNTLHPVLEIIQYTCYSSLLFPFPPWKLGVPPQYFPLQAEKCALERTIEWVELYRPLSKFPCDTLRQKFDEYCMVVVWVDIVRNSNVLVEASIDDSSDYELMPWFVCVNVTARRPSLVPLEVSRVHEFPHCTYWIHFVQLLPVDSEI